jgi:hypothetical protein
MEDDKSSATESTAPAEDSTLSPSTTEKMTDTDYSAALDKAFGIEDTKSDATQSKPKDESTDESEAEASSKPEEDATDQADADQDKPADEKPAESDDDKLSKEERQRQNDEFAKRRIEAAEAAKAEKLAREKEYLDEATDDADLENRTAQIESYNALVDKNNTILDSGIKVAVATIPLFKSNDPDIQEALAASLDDYENQYVTRDKTGNPTDIRRDVTEYLQSKAAEIERYMAKGERNAKANQAKTSAATLPTPSRAPAKAKVDPILAALSGD